jgi:predicted ATPase
VTRVTSATFLARDEQLQRLLAVYERARTHAAGVVVIGGEAGVGKSRLLAEFAARVRDDGGQTLIGGSIGFQEAMPYAPVVEALRPIVSSRDGAFFARVVKPSAESLGRLFPQMDAHWRRQGAEQDPAAQARLFEDVLNLLGRLGEESPTLLALEDLHWGDASTHALFSFLIRNLGLERVVLLATYRDDEVDRRHRLSVLLNQLERDRSIERIRLAGFERADFDQQLVEIRGEKLPHELADRIFERSGGNPFFTEELLARGLEAGEGDIPPTVRETLLGRFDRLSPDTQSVLTSAAVWS